MLHPVYKSCAETKQRESQHTYLLICITEIEQEYDMKLLTS